MMIMMMVNIFADVRAAHDQPDPDQDCDDDHDDPDHNDDCGDFEDDFNDDG